MSNVDNPIGKQPGVRLAAAESSEFGKLAARGSVELIDYLALQQSPAFGELRRRRARFVVPATAFVFCSYLAIVLLAAYEPDLMTHELAGQVNVGLALGILQLVSTVVITTWYTRFARGTIDPLVDVIRQQAGEPHS